MLERPENVELFKEAKVIVGCSNEIADRVYFNADDAIANIGDHEYIVFFDGQGKKLDEAEVRLITDGEYGVTFTF